MKPNIQVQWKWCHLIGHILFPIRLLCNHISILHGFRDIITYFPYIMNALVYLCINLHMTFEVPSFTDSKDMVWARFKIMDHVTCILCPLEIVCHPKASI